MTGEYITPERDEYENKLAYTQKQVDEGTLELVTAIFNSDNPRLAAEVVVNALNDRVG